MKCGETVEQNIYTHPNYTVSSSTQVWRVFRLGLWNQKVFEWSIFDTPFTSE